jgi:hypothetical protein
MSNLFDTYVVMGPCQSAVPVDVTPGEATQNRDI